MGISMEDIVNAYKERDGISPMDVATLQKEQQALLERELYELAEDSPFVAACLQYFESGIVSWQEMLLRLSIYLAKQNKALSDDLVKMKVLSTQLL